MAGKQIFDHLGADDGSGLSRFDIPVPEFLKPIKLGGSLILPGEAEQPVQIWSGPETDAKPCLARHALEFRMAKHVEIQAVIDDDGLSAHQGDVISTEITEYHPGRLTFLQEA